MSENLCVKIDDLAEILALPRDDERLRHLDACPRCLALRTEYLSFMEEPPSGQGLNSDEQQVLASNLDTALSREGLKRQDSGPRGSWSLPFPAWTAAPVLAAAVLLLIVIPRIQQPEPGPVMMRGQSLPDTMLTIHPAQVRSSGQIVLNWETLPEADSYAVQLISADLEILTVFEVSQGTELIIAGDEIGGKMAASRFWRVVAFRQGDVVARSALRPIPDKPSTD